MKKFRRLSCIILCAALSLAMNLTSLASYIVQPGVVIGEGLGPGAAPDGESVTEEPSAPAGDIGSTNWEPLLEQEPAPGGEAAGADTGAQASDPDLIYINGRLLSRSAPSVALTYDDGPNPDVGNRIMDLMEAYDSRCTFFLVGNRVPSRAAEVVRMVSEGFEVANHSYSHTYLDNVSASEVRSQVQKCNDVISQYAGVTPTLMRLPGGNKNSTVLNNVDMPIILWNVDTRDWATRNAQSTIDAVVGKVKDGDIVLMHELYSSTATASETIIPTLISQGFQLVTVSELATLKGTALQSGHVYYSF